MTDKERIEREAVTKYPHYPFTSMTARERKAYIAGATAECERGEAIEFAKWLRVDSWAITNPVEAIRRKSYDNNSYTYEDLYELFKQDKGIIKREKLRSLYLPSPPK